jgi:Spy/CpxP family protein refolding chaperone
MKKSSLIIAVALIGGILAGNVSLRAQGNGQRPARERNPEDMAKNQTQRLKEQLNLSAEQERSVYDLNLSFAKRMAEAREAAAASGGRPPMDSMRSWNQAREASMKKILTPEQYEKLQAEREKMRQQNGDRRPGGGGRRERR